MLPLVTQDLGVDAGQIEIVEIEWGQTQPAMAFLGQPLEDWAVGAPREAQETF